MAVENSGERLAVQGEGEAASRLLNMAQALVGCPDWCSWAAEYPDHQHYVIDQAELVMGSVRSLEGEHIVDVALEVRHTAHSARSGPLG